MLIVPTYHPILLSRDGDVKSEARHRGTVKRDFRRIFELTRRLPNWDESQITHATTFPTPNDVWAFFEALTTKDLTAVDVETTGSNAVESQLICIGFSNGKQTLCVPWLKQGGGVYWEEESAWQYVFDLVGQFFRDSHRKKLFHNGSFDSVVLEANGWELNGWEHDCYEDATTEFLTNRGWLKYDQVTPADRLGTINPASGQLEFQPYKSRVDKLHTGNLYTIQTRHTQTTVTPNHRLFVQPYYRARTATSKYRPWEFRRAEQIYNATPDQYYVRTSFTPEPDTETADPVYNGIQFTPHTLKLLGLVATDEAQFHKRLYADIGKPTGHPDRLVEVFYDLIGHYSKLRRFPYVVLSWPRRHRQALFAGLMLGDASENTQKTGYIFRSFSEDLLDGVQALALSLGYTASIGKATSDCPGVFIHGKQETENLIARERKEYATTGEHRTVRGHFVTTAVTDRRVVCFETENTTLVTRSGGMVAFHGNSLLMHHVLDAELPHSLAFLNSLYNELRFYKDDVHDGRAWLDLPDNILRLYNQRDALVTRRIYDPLLQEISKYPRFWELYKVEVEQAKMMARATLRGMLTDRHRRDSHDIDERPHKPKKKPTDPDVPNPDYGYPVGLRPRMVRRRSEALDAIQNVAGWPLNPGSPKQLTKFLYQDMGMPIVKRSKTGNPATDKEALLLLSLIANENQRAALTLIAKYRKADKIIGTYLDGLPPGEDNRVHPVWKIHGTVSGRYSSTPNFQNFNATVKSIFMAPPGYKYVSIDLSQAELRVMAYLAKDLALLEMYEKGVNVHTVNTTMLFKVRNPGADTNEATEEFLLKSVPNYMDLPVAAAGKWKPLRLLAKRFVFARNYGAIGETIHANLRSERDPETDLQLFPDLALNTVEALCKAWFKIHPQIPKYHQFCENILQRYGYFDDILSGRRRWFRAGPDRNQLLNYPIQTLVASHMQRTLEIYKNLPRDTYLISQIHDAVTCEVPEEHIDYVKKLMLDVFNRPFELPGFPNAILPGDEPTVGTYFNEV